MENSLQHSACGWHLKYEIISMTIQRHVTSSKWLFQRKKLTEEINTNMTVYTQANTIWALHTVCNMLYLLLDIIDFFYRLKQRVGSLSITQKKSNYFTVPPPHCSGCLVTFLMPCINLPIIPWIRFPKSI